MPFGSRRDGGERTAEDRARAAAERAARRAKPPPPPEAFQDTVPPPDVEAAPRHEAASADEPGPGGESVPADESTAAFEPMPADEPTPPDESRAAYEPETAADPAPAYEPIAADESTAAYEPETAADPAPEYEPVAADESATAYESAPPQTAPAYDPRDDAQAARPVTAVEERPLPPRRVPTARRRRPAPVPRARRGSWRRRTGAVLALALIAGALYVINATFQPFHGDGTGSVRVNVPEGADAGKIGDLLAERGVVASATFFQLNATFTGRRGGLRSGEYTLRRDMSNGDAIAALEQGPRVRVVPTIDITVPEGPSIRETAAIVDKGPLEGRYAQAASGPRVLRRIRELGAPRRTDTAEGFLFPATYKLAEGAPARNLVGKQLDAFEDNFGSIDLAYAKRRNLTRYDVLIIASLVERETQLARERPLVASVIYNRLRERMPLGIDATIRYQTRNWSRPIRVSELEADTPYNTRLRRGLPPTPIGNPGLKSIQAAARPARTDYLFFVRKPGKTGEHAFSSTDAQFQRDYERYQASRGG